MRHAAHLHSPLDAPVPPALQEKARRGCSGFAQVQKRAAGEEAHLLPARGFSPFPSSSSHSIPVPRKLQVSGACTGISRCAHPQDPRTALQVRF